jgi:hypothetical protein
MKILPEIYLKVLINLEVKWRKRQRRIDAYLGLLYDAGIQNVGIEKKTWKTHEFSKAMCLIPMLQEKKNEVIALVSFPLKSSSGMQSLGSFPLYFLRTKGYVQEKFHRN